jgi:hypothetical protein
MVWPDGSWAFSKLLGDERIRSLASIACVLATIGFVAGGVGILFGLTWWLPIVMGSAIFSVLIFVLCWDGKLDKMSETGGIGVLINIAIIIATLTLDWSSLGI